MPRLSLLAGLLLLPTATAAAQGTLSGQGFGYPPGQISTRVEGTAGALGEFDPQSPINPATVAQWGPAGLHFQYSPEFRRVLLGDRSQSTMTSRFPVFGAAVPVGERASVGLAFSTLLDRTWQTSNTGVRTIRGDTVTSTSSFRSSGAINDVRIAAAYTLAPWLSVGIGLHAITGENRLGLRETFASDAYTPLDTARFISYSGSALSAGAEWRPIRGLAVAGSARRGGTIRARTELDSLLSTAKVPDRVGAAIRVDRIAGATLAARVDWQGWSSLQSLGRNTQARDALDLSAGAEIAGPSIAGTTVLLRAGGRTRTLPFEAAGAEVRERAVSGGAGVPIAYGRALVDVTLQRAWRTTDGDIAERAWLLGVGLTIRP